MAMKVYDFSKGGTDISNQRCGSFTSATKTRRWPTKMLEYVLDVTRVNAQSVYCLNTGKDPNSGLDSFRFDRDLALSLVKPNMVAGLPTIQNRAIQTKIQMVVKPAQEEAEGEDLVSTQELQCRKIAVPYLCQQPPCSGLQGPPPAAFKDQE